MKRPLLWVGIFYALGEVTGKIAYTTGFFVIVTAIVLLACLIIGSRVLSIFIWIKDNMKLLLLIFMSFLGGFSVFYFDRYNAVNANADGAVIKCELRVIAAEPREKSVRYIAKADGIKYLMYVSYNDEYSAENVSHTGEYIFVEGVIRRFAAADNPGGFDKRSYYETQGIYYEIENAHVRYRRGKESKLAETIRRIKASWSSAIDKVFDSYEAGILKTMILGDDSDLSEDTRLLYQKNGIAHLLAISGLHTALIGSAVVFLLRRLIGIRKNISAFISIVMISLYGMLTGFSVPTMRAVIMLLIAYLADIRGRTADSVNSLAAAFLIITFIEPGGVFSSGLQMSFAAVIGVSISGVIFEKRVKPRLYMLKGRTRAIIKTLLMTVIVNMFMLPLVIYRYYEFPLYGMLISLVCVSLLSVAIGSGILASFVSVMSLSGGKVIGIPAKYILRFYKMLCSGMIKLPFSILNPGHVRIVVLILYYLVLSILIYMVVKGRTRKRRSAFKSKVIRHRSVKLAVMFVSNLIIFIVFTYWLNIKDRHVDFLYVGQGDGCILHTGYYSNYIIDCGSSSNDSVGQYTLIPALKYYGMSSIDSVFISHGDMDHISGLVFAMENAALYGINIDTIYLPNGIELDQNIERLLKAAQMSHTSVKTLAAEPVDDEATGEQGAEHTLINNANVRVIYPFLNTDKQVQGNDRSLCLYVEFKDIEFIFTGDISSEVESQIIDNQAVPETGDKYRILKAAHHGSRFSNSEEFIEFISPDMTVISAGRDNIYGHPHIDTLNRLVNNSSGVYQTKDYGAIRFDLLLKD